jgi:hypothetical protein
LKLKKSNRSVGFDIGGYNFLDGFGIMWDVNGLKCPIFNVLEQIDVQCFFRSQEETIPTGSKS